MLPPDQRLAASQKLLLALSVIVQTISLILSLSTYQLSELWITVLINALSGFAALLMNVAVLVHDIWLEQ